MTSRDHYIGVSESESSVSNVKYLFKAVTSFPERALSTMLLAIASEFPGSFASACCKATSASSNRPRCISATACDIKLWDEDPDGAASSSKT